ncbi:hypothetical protein VTN00DRAFT_9677 [Thermoascus crustaceus]|uniref:uncharacterized protein n=1 Tax=Thermoascus crustaceus TaxID=5088 RepID=UPI0037429BD3
MKLLTKEEEAAHYNEVLKGGTVGGITGLVGGLAAVMAASRRYPAFNSLTLPLKAFLVTSSGTFFGIVAADHASRSFEAQRNADTQYLENREQRLRREELAQMSFKDRAVAWAKEEKYKIIGATWLASMVGSFVLVGRNPYLSGQQKIVQARVYAQGLTLAVLCASAAFEIHDQRKGQGILDAAKKGQQANNQVEQPVHISHERSEDLWKDMVAAEEQRLREKEQSLHQKEEKNKRAQQEKKEQH